MSWHEREEGTWFFTKRKDETFYNAFQRCTNNDIYIADESDWAALLVIAADLIAAKLNPGGKSGPLGSSFQVESWENDEVQPQNAE
ncbi:hypothetical protein CBG25_19400 [Arsenophonus sp. ENCA]|uniref:hypothetical protein n=1 Tax=Arsenophonus sp. ENCA TaxID=1987579 RepID=UPI000BC900A7|nr:hypothetical protein [Arsenophonus sp. ENCA]PAV00351.1 hypothetical protein CBG25_19400 [Arsenophonus sp. ENCA]